MEMQQVMGTRSSERSGRWERLLFSGEPQEFEAWSVKIQGYLRLRKLHGVFADVRPEDYEEKNRDVFAELIQFLDDRSLALVMREAKDDGRKAFKVLQEHYSGKSKPRIITLYTELTSLAKSNSESITDYVIRAEKTACALQEAGEQVSDSLCVAMILKGLPAAYKPFVTVVTQRKEETTLQELKAMLRSEEELEEIQPKDHKVNDEQLLVANT